MNGLLVASLLATCSLGRAQPHTGSAGASVSRHTVDCVLVIDASTSMKAAWEACVGALPDLFTALEPGDRIRVIVFGEGSEVLVNEVLSHQEQAQAVAARLRQRVHCNQSASDLASAIKAVVTKWGSTPSDGAVLVVLTDGIVYPPAGPRHDAEWTARWEASKPLRQASNMRRVLVGVRTEEASGRSLERLGQCLVPTERFVLGEDDLGQFREIMGSLHQLVQSTRTAAPPSLTAVTTPRKARSGLTVIGLASGGVLLLALVLALLRSRATAATQACASPGAVLVDAWSLDAQFQPVGEPVHWMVPVPARGRATVLLGSEEQGVTEHALVGVKMVAQEPVQVIADKTGILGVSVPAFETVLVGDETPSFRLDARCQEEETFSAVEAGPTVARFAPRGSSIRLRLPGMNEVRLRYHRLEGSDGREARHATA